MIGALSVAAGAIAVTAAAAVVHRALLRSPSLAAVVPGYPAWWFGISHGSKAAVAVTLPVAGAMTGLAFRVSPLPALGTVLALAAAAAVTVTIRALARRER